ncbi:MAG: lipopolysaccharide heptosyltransferase family protein [Chlorobiota bacterium]|nr:MAG: lipopolysaccharide heptosyltransferase family protein [Chlorobiota bacterium]
MRREHARRILADARTIGVVRTDHLGDMVLTLPLVRALRQEYPLATIVLIAHSRTAPLAEWAPDVDRCYFVDQIPLERVLRHERFDALFFPRARADEAWQAWCAGVPLRVGTRYRWWSPLYSVRIPDHRHTAEYHEAEYNVRMLEYITGKRYRVELLRPCVPNSVRTEVSALLAGAGIEEPFLVLHPGGRGSAPRWEKFPALAMMLARERPDVRIVVTGTTSEGRLCAAIADAVPSAVNFCGKLQLTQLIALLERAAVVVANSTGVLHIAAALGRAVVGLFPAEPPAQSPARWRPLGERTIVLACSPIDALPVHSVARAIEAVLSA